MNSSYRFLSLLLTSYGIGQLTLNAQLPTTIGQPVTLRGRLVDSDTKQTVANVPIIARSRSRSAQVFQSMTGKDGSFSMVVQAGTGYAICSESGGKYMSTCVFGKPVYLGSESLQQPLQLMALTGIPVRIRLNDAANLVRVTTDSLLWVDPLDLLVYVQETITNTRVSLALTSQPPQSLEYVAVIPSGSTWRLAMSSARHSIIDQTSRQPYRADAPIPTVLNAAGESVAVFSLQ